MSAARRLYLYSVSAISLLVLSVAVANLVALAVARFGLGSDWNDILVSNDALRRSAIFSLAMALVALPVWALHWWLAERSADEPAEDDRVSFIRAAYLLGAFGIALIFVAVRVHNLIEAAVAELFSDAYNFTDRVHPESTTATLIVSGAIVAYHAHVRRRDTAIGEMNGASDWLGRLAVHLVALTGAWMVLLGTARLLALAIESLAQPAMLVDSQAWVRPLASSIALTLTGLVLWMPVWLYGLRMLRSPTWTRDRWRASMIRRGYLIGFGAACTFVVMALASQMLEALLMWLLADAGNGVEIIVLGVRALPFIAFAAYHFRLARIESHEHAAERQRAETGRSIVYATSFIGIAFAGFGVAGIVALAIDSSGSPANAVLAADEGWRGDFSRLLGIALTGLAVWLWNWLRIERTVASETWMDAHPGSERNALTRRVYLLAVCGSAVVALFLSLASLLYWLLAAALDIPESDRLAVDFTGPLAIVFVSTPLLVYHLLQLRADAAVRPDAQAASETPEAAASITMLLTGPGDDAVRDMAARLSASLPEGFTLTANDPD